MTTSLKNIVRKNIKDIDIEENVMFLTLHKNYF